MARRRLVLAVSVAVFAVSILAALVGLLPLRALALSSLLLAGGCGWLRVTATQAARQRRDSRSRGARRSTGGYRDFTAPQPGNGDAESLPLVRWVTPVAPVAATRPEAAAPGATVNSTVNVTGSGAPWTPVPIPLPSYVTAAPAPRVVEGDFHEEDLVDGELPGEAAAYALGDDVLERRRAVGD